MFSTYYLRVIQSRWRLIAGFVLAALVLSLVISYITTPIYRATATFVINPNESLPSSRDFVDTLATLDSRSIISTYRDIFLSKRVFTDTLQSLGFSAAEAQHYEPSVVVGKESNIMTLNVDGPDAGKAVMLADAIGQTAISYIQGFSRVFSITVLDQAYAQPAAVKPQILRDAGIAALVGLVLGLLAVLINESYRTSLGTLKDRLRIDRISNATTRKHFLRTFEQMHEANKVEPLSVAIISLDGIREYFGELSEPLQMTLMRKVTDSLRNLLRGSDIVARWDNTSMVVGLPLTTEQAAFRAIERIKETLSQPVTLEITGDKVDLEPHIGATSRRGDEGIDTLIKNAEKALTESYQNDNQIAFFNTESLSD